MFYSPIFKNRYVYKPICTNPYNKQLYIVLESDDDSILPLAKTDQPVCHAAGCGDLVYILPTPNTLFLHEKKIIKLLLIHLSRVPKLPKSLKKTLSESFIDYMNIFLSKLSFTQFFRFFKTMFANIPVPKQRKIFYLMRMTAFFIYKKSLLMDGFNLAFKGKLCRTGNKRTTKYACLNGHPRISNIPSVKLTDHRLICTTTGVFSCKSLVTYNH